LFSIGARGNLRLDRWPAAVGAFLGIVFLLVDSVGHAAFGNTGFGRMWQGKAIVWILFLPVALSLSYRFLRLGNGSDLAWLSFLAIEGVGLSNAARYSVPRLSDVLAFSFLRLNSWIRRDENIFGRSFAVVCF